jgi:ribulose-5-phosphate 4-epimerase/fuculose-1-phosphate aldolase
VPNLFADFPWEFTRIVERKDDGVTLVDKARAIRIALKKNKSIFFGYSEAGSEPTDFITPIRDAINNKADSFILVLDDHGSYACYKNMAEAVNYYEIVHNIQEIATDTGEAGMIRKVEDLCDGTCPNPESTN